MNDINQNDYLALVGLLHNPLPNYVDVNNMDEQDYTSTITSIINIFVNRNAGLTPKNYFFNIVVNRLSEDGHVTKEVAISLLSTRMMNANHPVQGPFQAHQAIHKINTTIHQTLVNNRFPITIMGFRPR